MILNSELNTSNASCKQLGTGDGKMLKNMKLKAIFSLLGKLSTGDDCRQCQIEFFKSRPYFCIFEAHLRGVT